MKKEDVMIAALMLIVFGGIIGAILYQGDKHLDRIHTAFEQQEQEKWEK